MIEVDFDGVQEPRLKGLDGRWTASSLLRPLLRTDIASSGTTLPPLIWVLGAIAVVAYADHRIVTVSLIYLYILPLSRRGDILAQRVELLPHRRLHLATLFRFAASNPVERAHFS